MEISEKQETGWSAVSWGVLKGTWLKDKERSDTPCYARQLDLLGVTGVKKATATRFFNGIHLDVNEDGESCSNNEWVPPTLPLSSCDGGKKASFRYPARDSFQLCALMQG
jgi:hypothetical protein